MNNEIRYNFYNKKFPEPHDLIMGKITEVCNVHSYIDCLEYSLDGKPLIAAIDLSEYSTKRIYTHPNKFFTVGAIDVFYVVRVDENGYVDLSKKKCVPEAVFEFKEQYASTKILNSIMLSVSQKSHICPTELYEKIIYPLYDLPIHPYYSLKGWCNKELDVLHIDEAISTLNYKFDEFKNLLLKETQVKLANKNLSYTADFTLTCHKGGISTLTNITNNSINSNDDPEINVKILIISSPLYRIIVTSKNYLKSEKVINDLLKLIENKATQNFCAFKIETQPRLLDAKEHMSSKVINDYIQNLNNNNENDESCDDEGMNIELDLEE